MHSKPSKISSMEGLMFTTSRVLGVLRGCSLSIFVVDDYGIRFWFGFPVTIFFFSSFIFLLLFSCAAVLHILSANCNMLSCIHWVEYVLKKS